MRLAAIEREKLGTDPGDPDVARLSEEAFALSRRLKEAGQAEAEIARDLTSSET